MTSKLGMKMRLKDFFNALLFTGTSRIDFYALKVRNQSFLRGLIRLQEAAKARYDLKRLQIPRSN